PGQVVQRRRQAGNGGGQRAVQRQLALHRAIASVEVGAGRRRSALAGVDEAVGRRLSSLAQQEETSAAETRAIGLGHRQGGGDGHRGIEGVAAVGQGFQAGDGGGGVGGGDGGLLRRRGCRLGAERAGQ